ncbi:hypothetical protein UlMin_011366 [Ulmus minor]
MESEKLLNPRAFGLPSTTIAATIAAKAMPNDLAQKPPPSIVDRFKALLKQRDDDLRVSADDDVSLPRTEEIVHFYELILSELTFNSKPIITDLTIIAGEQREHAKGIAEAICARILEVPVEQKLPSLYLLDSIVKNIGREYVKYFSSRLPEVFCEAYKQVPPNQHPSMRHLFGTWSAVFPPSVLHKIEVQLQFSPSVNQSSSGLPPLRASESPRPTHGIHVNPKYLRQLEHTAPDTHIQHAGESSNLRLYGQKPAIGFEEFESDHADVVSSQVGAKRLSSTGSVGHATFSFGANKLHPSSTARLARATSPSSIGHDRAIGRDEEPSKWQRKHYNNQNPLETSAAYKLSNGRELQGPRALIDAYGSDRRETISNDRPLQLERLDTNGLDHKVTSMAWQNTEEEEFDWEDMSPTLADHDRTNDFLPSSVPFGRPRPGFGGSRTSPSDSDGRNPWSSQAHLPTVDDSSFVTEDAVPSIAFGRGSTGKRFHNETNHNLVSRMPQEPWNKPHHLSQPSQHLVDSIGRGRNFQMPLLSSSLPSSGGENISRFIEKLPDDTPHNGPLIAEARSLGLRPQLHVRNVYPPPLHSMFPTQNQKRQYDFMNSSNTVKAQGPNKSLYMPRQQLDNFGNKELNSIKPQFPNQNALIFPHNQQNQGQTPLQSQPFPTKEAREHFLTSVAAPVPPHLVTPNLDRGYTSQGHGSAISAVISNSISLIPNGSLPPLPPGLPPGLSQALLPTQNAGTAVPSQPPGGAFSGLISSLMAQGLISLSKPTPVQESIGVEFDVDLLKVRHESAINALYGYLPRQCTTCGLRFKCQDEHSTHMDWHVTKNRMSKSRKQKPSRKWFVSTSMWLSGAEALGTDAVPGFLPIETVVEKMSDEEMAVPSDDDQKACALCGEDFDDFYSDEMEEWMYRGAVYMNAPDGSTAGMDRSQLGPIVHAKCRSDSSLVSPESVVLDEEGTSEEGNRRKRLRI